MAKRISDPFKFDRAYLAEYGVGTLGAAGTGRVSARSAAARRAALGARPDGAPAVAGSRPDFAGHLAGADEAGRGCLAGPLVAAAVVLDYNLFPFKALKGLTDSKMMTLEARERMYVQIVRSSARVAVSVASPQTIDRLGLHVCNLELLRRCLETLDLRYELAIIDAFDLRRPELRSRGITGADYKSGAVAAASVVAKVVRDRLMRRMAPSYPEYGFEEHVGYATETHRRALRLHGPSRIHRFSFQGVANPSLDNWDEATKNGAPEAARNAEGYVEPASGEPAEKRP